MFRPIFDGLKSLTRIEMSAAFFVDCHLEENRVSCQNKFLGNSNVIAELVALPKTQHMIPAKS